MMLLLAGMGCRAAKGDAHVVRDSIAPARIAPPTADTATMAMTRGADVDFFTAAELSRAAAEIARGASTATVLARRPDHYYVQARRVASGTPEVHDDYSDVTFVQAGRAVLHTGTSVHGSRVESAGEHRGGTIVGGTSRPIAAGDFFVIGAGVPHRYELAAGDSIRYLTVKVRKTR